MKIKTILLSIISLVTFFSCDSQKDKIHNVVIQMMSKSVDIPYEQMECWSTDSLLQISPWKQAKLKLVHFVDSTQCSGCYLQKMAMHSELFQFERYYRNAFVNIFIIEPAQRDRKILYEAYCNELLPMTIFVDTTHVFSKLNAQIPKEFMFHTFLLDENNKVIFVGNPLTNPKMRELFLAKVDGKLGRNKMLKR